MLVFTYFIIAYFIYFIILILIKFELINIFKANKSLFLIMKSIKL